MRQEYQDNIDKYLLDRMSDEERVSFEAKCARNAEMKEQLEHTRNVRTIISERSKMLAKIQEWDDEYDAKEKVVHNKTTWIYWLSGIAAMFIVGFFLFPVNRPSGLGSSRELASMKQEPQSMMTGDNAPDSCMENKEQERLLAQDDDKKDARDHIAKPENDQVLSFGKSDFEIASPSGQEGMEYELRQIEEKNSAIKQKIAQLRQQLNDSEISQEFYDSSIGLLRYQRDQLSWRKARLLIDLDRTNEAMEILKELRREEGAFRNKADSLYNEIK